MTRTIYTILGLVLGTTLTLYYLNKTFAKTNANNLALTYYRSCTTSAAYMYYHNKLTVDQLQDGYKQCQKRSRIYHEILLKNL